MFFNFVLASNKNHVVDLDGLFGSQFPNMMRKKYSNKAMTYLFRTLSYRTIVFDEFFAMEVVNLLKGLVNDYKYNRYGVNIRTIKNAIEKIEKITWLNYIHGQAKKDIDRDAIKGLMHYDPLDHQNPWFDYYERVPAKYGLRGALLHGSPGSGKTFMSLALAEMLHADRIVVICPNTATDRVWVSSVRDELYKKKQSFWASNFNTPYNGERIAIYHYEALNKALKDIDLLKANKVVMILDESHYLNEKNSKRTQLFYNLAMGLKSNDIILATGTPIKALGVELVPILKLLDPLFTKAVSRRFQKMFRGASKYKLELLKERLGLISLKINKSDLKLKETVTYKQKVKLKNGSYFTLSKIKERMKKFIEEREDYYSKHKDEITAYYEKIIEDFEFKYGNTPDLRQYKSDIEEIKLGYQHGRLRFIPDIMKRANRFEKDIIIPTLSQEDKKKFRDAKTVVKYLGLKIQGECLGIIVTGSRIECHVAMAEQIKYRPIVDATLKKTVIFTNYIKVGQAALDTLEKENYSPLSVFGSNTKELATTVKAFTENENLNPLVATYKSLSTAVPIVVADTLIIIDMPFRTYVYEQAVARVHRLRQDSQVKIYQMELDTGNEPNINTRGLDIITWSKEMVEAITGMVLPYDLAGKEISENVSNEDVNLEKEINNFLTSLLDKKIEENKRNITTEQQNKTHLEW
jgi:SNF2 family DNA or RNA helicase